MFAELLLGQPIFPGDSGVDQLVEIIKVLGTPTKEQIRQMNSNYTEFKFPQIKAHPWNKVGAESVCEGERREKREREESKGREGGRGEGGTEIDRESDRERERVSKAYSTACICMYVSVAYIVII